MSDKQRLSEIAKSFGMSFYQLLQALLLCLVRYFDKDAQISDEHRQMIEAFKNIMASAAGSFGLLSVKDYDRQHVTSAILFLQRDDAQRPQTIAVARDGCGRLTETYNQDSMLADFLGAIDPESLQRLRTECKQQGLFSISHLLHKLIRQNCTPPADEMAEEIRGMFDDLRIPTGLPVNREVFYKRTPNRGMGEERSTVFRNPTYRADLNTATHRPQ